MKKLLFIVATLIMATNVQLSAQKKINLNSGKPIQVRLTSEILSNSKSHIQPTAIIEKDVRNEDGKVLISRGTPVNFVCDTHKSKGMGKPGEVKLNFTSTTAVDGQEIALQGVYGVRGNDRKGVALGVGLGTGLTVLFPVGFFFFCIKGEPVTIPDGTIITGNIVVNENYKILVTE